MFKEIQEIKTWEKLSQKEKPEEGYKKIKPETGLTIEEAQKFWDDFFREP